MKLLEACKLRLQILLLVAAFLSAAVMHAAEGAIRLDPVLQGLSSPVYITNAHDGSNRLFIVEQAGRIKVLLPGATSPTLFLDIASKVLSGGERGLLGLAFHPQFGIGATSRFFVNYTRQTDGATVIAEYHVSADPDVAATTETILLTIAQPYSNHNGGMIEFGFDGFLYIGVGDGGSSNDPQNRAQNINDLLGKILRIDVDHPAGQNLYSSPPGNPYLGSTPGSDEIYAVGMRNPFRFSFDRQTGQLYVGDVGQGAFEEVDVVTPGGNYGWRVYEGTQCTNLDPALCTPTNYAAPIVQYSHSGGRCSITGGYVYRGAASALPGGAYVFGDYCTGEIFSLAGGAPSLLLDTALNISSFGEDEAGELYVVGLGGTVHRISSTATTTTVASSGSPAVTGAVVTFTATVSGANPSGSVGFAADGGAAIAGCGAVALVGTGNSRTAACSTSGLAVGSHSIVASYAGDAGNAGSSSAPLTQVINPGAGANVALASAGAVALASSSLSNYPVAGVNNGDRKGVNWGQGGGWADATYSTYPDSVQITFNGVKTIDRVVLYTLQDNYANPVEPTDTLGFASYGVTAFTVQGWTGSAWVDLGSVSNNNLVKRSVVFAPFSTDRIRVIITGSLNPYSCLVEIEAWGVDAGAGANVALSSAGAVALASSSLSNYPVAGVNNGDRKGVNWGQGGGWADATYSTYPDSVQITFNGVKTIDRVVLYTLQDNYANPVEPTDTLGFASYGVTAFTVQGWTGSAWVDLGSVSNNNLVKRSVVFAPFSTDRIRVIITGSLNPYSCLVEIEAWGVDAGGLPPTTTTVASSGSPAVTGAVVTFTATVSGATPSGSVGFAADGGAAIAGCGAVALVGTGNSRTAACSTSGLAVGSHSIVASYAGDAGNAGSSSAPLTQVINPGAGANVALASAGAVALASSSLSNYPVAGVNNGDRKGVNWGQGGGWADATYSTYPDSVQITFNGVKTIDRVVLYTLQDNYANPVEPTDTLGFASYGVTAFTVQGWTGSAWVDLGSVSNNNLVKRSVVFAPFSTDRIRVIITGSLNPYSCLVEIEAWGVDAGAGANVALSSAGAVALASSSLSNYPVAGVNNGDRKGVNWGQGGGWADATYSTYPDSVQITFNGVKTIDRVVLYTLQDNYANPVEPTDGLSFASYGVTAFTVQGWTGSAWVDLGSVSNNNLVKRSVAFAPFSTDRIRVTITGSLNPYSCVVEIEAWAVGAGTPPASLTGSISVGSTPLAGVQIAASSGGSCQASDAAGNYSCTVPQGWSGTITPSLSAYSFAPPWRSYSNVTASQAAQDYAASAITGGLVPWNTFGRDAQHTALSTTASQPLNQIHWQTPVDLQPQYTGNGSLLIHYGSPVITPANTVIVPVKTGATGGFRVEARTGSTGALQWSMNSDYILPAHNWVPAFGPALTSQSRLYFPGAGGTIYFRDQADAAAGTSGQLAFYGLASYQANPQAYDTAVKINTPITTDPSGNLYFGFQVTGSTPLGLVSGIARVSASGQGTWIPVTTAAADTNMTKVPHNSAPALSSDHQTLYAAVSNGSSGYLVALDSTTLAPLARVLLVDPKSGQAAQLSDNGSASPTVGTDGDVYFGVLENPFGSNHRRGWLLHFNASLSQSKTPGAFGWDTTVGLVPVQMVPSYQGTSAYLLMTKYNHYLGLGGDGMNKIAILDPNATQTDPVTQSTVMKEVLTMLGPTPDSGGGVKEWCINTAAVDPGTKSVLANNEDGKLYRWDLTTNTLSQTVVLTAGLGEAYTSTVIGPDGKVYATNNATLFAVGQ